MIIGSRYLLIKVECDEKWGPPHVKGWVELIKHEKASRIYLIKYRTLFFLVEKYRTESYQI